MSVRERQAWLAVVTTAFIWPAYIFTFFSAFAARDLDGWALLNLFVWTLGIHVVVLLGSVILFAHLRRENFDAPPDELERQLEARADKLGRGVLEFSVASIAIATLWISGLARADFAADPAGATAIMMANFLMFAGMAAGIVRETTLIVQFRRTAAI